MKLYTIGFTRKSAEHFFQRLEGAEVRRIIDVRLNNVSQLSGFAKKGDLAFFLREISSVGYSHRLDLAPTRALLEAYRTHRISWDTYASQFLELMTERRIQDTLSDEITDSACLLCSEDRPERCHRRLVAEYLRNQWNDVDIVHL